MRSSPGLGVCELELVPVDAVVGEGRGEEGGQEGHVPALTEDQPHVGQTTSQVVVLQLAAPLVHSPPPAEVGEVVEEECGGRQHGHHRDDTDEPVKLDEGAVGAEEESGQRQDQLEEAVEGRDGGEAPEVVAAEVARVDGREGEVEEEGDEVALVIMTDTAGGEVAVVVPFQYAAPADIAMPRSVTNVFKVGNKSSFLQ